MTIRFVDGAHAGMDDFDSYIFFLQLFQRGYQSSHRTLYIRLNDQIPVL